LSAASEAKTPEDKVILIMDANDKTRTALSNALRDQNWQVTETAGLREAIQAARDRPPWVIVLDWDIEEGIGPEVMILFHEDPSTGGIPLIACGNGSAVETRFAALRAGATDYLSKPIDVRSLREILKRIIKSQTEEEEKANDNKSEKFTSNKSIYTRSLQCKLHKPATSFIAFCLRSKTQMIEYNLFDIPRYIRGLGNADYCNFHLLESRVCPDCFFASSDDGQFAVLAGHVKETFNPTERLINIIGRSTPHRRNLGAHIGQNLWTENRSVDDALVAFELAASSAQALYEAMPGSYAQELCRIAGYKLKSAELQLSLKKDKEGHDQNLRQSLETLERAYLELDEGVNLFRVIYQIVALMVWFGRDGPSRQYLSRFMELRKKLLTSLPEKHKGILNRYYEHARMVYEDRDIIREREIP